MDCSTPVFPVLHYLPEFAQIHAHWVSDAIQWSHSLSPPSPSAINLSQHQDLFQWVSSSHQVARVLELPLQHQNLMGYSLWTHRRVRHNFKSEQQQPHLNHLCIPNSECSGALGDMTGSGWSMTWLKAHNYIIRYWRAGDYLALSPNSVYCLNTDDALKRKKNACWVLLEENTQYHPHRAEKGLAADFPRSVAWGRSYKNPGSAKATLVKNRALFRARTPSEQGLFQSKTQSLACVPQVPGAQQSLCGGATESGDAHLPNCID